MDNDIIKAGNNTEDIYFHTLLCDNSSKSRIYCR